MGSAGFISAVCHNTKREFKIIVKPLLWFFIPGSTNQNIMAKIKLLKSVLTLFFSFWVMALFAQGDGSAGIAEATNMVTSYFDPATRLIYAIGAIVGLIGGVKVYSKFSSGDPDTGKTAAAWFGACIFLIVAATILRSFFL